MKTIIITGANSGLGFETAKKIAKHGDCKIILACRSMEKAERAKVAIVGETGNQNVVTMPLDTSSLRSVRSFAQEILSQGETIDVLINNAGISPMHSGITEDGFELVFATNHLGHFLLTNLLLPILAGDARIFNVASDMHDPPGGIHWPGVELLAHPKGEDRKKYSYSKLCNLYFTYELDRRLRGKGSHITVNAFNPGYMADTNFAPGQGKTRAMTVKLTMPERYGTLETSSDALAELAVSGAFSGVSGKYLDRSTSTTESSSLSYDEANTAELWRKSAELCGLDGCPLQHY